MDRNPIDKLPKFAARSNKLERRLDSRKFDAIKGKFSEAMGKLRMYRQLLELLGEYY